MPKTKRNKRFEVLENRPVHKDGFIGEWVDVGLYAMGSPNDPKPSIKIENGKVVEMDGVRREDFNMNEQFVADYAIDLAMAPKAMAMSEQEIAHMLVDINVPRTECTKVMQGLTPAKIAGVMDKLDIAEIILAMHKMRTRGKPGNQAHITSATDNPVLLVADAAEGALRGFLEVETTVAVVRYAPLNALSLLIGSQTGRPGTLTQCSLEEAFELQIGMRGLTAYAETISVYGTENVFIDGDDTPWSKAFLASCYASRGLKMRFTSGTGSEVQMGAAEGKSMLYLEVLCIMLTKGAGVQGLQNGSISCIGVPGAVPSGLRAVAAENLVTTALDLEVASGNDQTFSHSDLRRTARTMPQFFAGTDFVFSGYSGVPNYDNMFAGSNWDIEDEDDYLALQRDFKVDGGNRPVLEADVVAVRNKAARAERLLKEGINGASVVKALAKGGFEDIAKNVLMMLKQRISGDYLQTSSWVAKDGYVWSAVNDPNTYTGPGTGYQLSPERWEEIKNIPWAIRPEDV